MNLFLLLVKSVHFMENILIFSDASINPKLKCGIGGYLLIGDSFFKDESPCFEKLKNQLILKQFHNTSSTKLEVQTVLWSLEDYINCQNNNSKITIYSDSQCVTGLNKRRVKLEKNDFCSKKNDKLLKNAFLYQQFYQYYDKLNFEVIKVKGHLPSKNKDTIHRIFSIVDRGVRKALKKWIKDMDSLN